eukprot:Gb_04162 [translate_table: standard]
MQGLSFPPTEETLFYSSTKRALGQGQALEGNMDRLIHYTCSSGVTPLRRGLCGFEAFNYQTSRTFLVQRDTTNDRALHLWFHSPNKPMLFALRQQRRNDVRRCGHTNPTDNIVMEDSEVSPPETGPWPDALSNHIICTKDGQRDVYLRKILFNLNAWNCCSFGLNESRSTGVRATFLFGRVQIELRIPNQLPAHYSFNFACKGAEWQETNGVFPQLVMEPMKISRKESVTSSTERSKNTTENEEPSNGPYH